MNELRDKKWPVVIKGNILTNWVAALLGIASLVAGSISFAFGIHCIGKTDLWDGAILFSFIAIIFFFLAYGYIIEIMNISVYFKFAADEKGICLMMNGKYVSIPYEDIRSIWAGEPYNPIRPGHKVTLVIKFKKDFFPYKNFIANYFFHFGGHKIRYGQLALGMSPYDARDLLKTYWPAE